MHTGELFKCSAFSGFPLFVMSNIISFLWRLELHRRRERSQQWRGLKQLFECLWVTCICPHAVQTHVLCPDKADEEWASVCHMSVMLGIDQSHIGSGDKAHGDDPTTPALQLCYPVKHKPSTAPPTWTSHQLQTNHVRSGGEHVEVPSPHLEATGM